MKVFGLPVVGIIVAAIAVFFIGFLWYGVLFQNVWMTGEGVTEASYEGDPSWWMAVGFLISVAVAKGIAFALKYAGWPDMSKAMFIGFALGMTLGGAFAAYDWVYLPSHNFTLFLVNWSHTVVGYVVAAAILTKMKNI